MAVDAVELQRQQMQEAAVNAERIRKENVAVFERMFISLGPDAIRIAGSSSFDAQLAEARGLAAHRWSSLLQLEAQSQRDAAAVASRPRKRPGRPSDETVPDRTLEKWNAAWEEETASMRREVEALKTQAKNERRELESWRVDYRKGK